MKSSALVLAALASLLQPANAKAEEFSDSNHIFDYTWSYSGGTDTGQLSYLYTNNTELTITPLGAHVEIRCSNGAIHNDYMYLELDKGVLPPGETATMNISYKYLEDGNPASVPPPCQYQGGISSIGLVREPSARQTGIRSSKVQCMNIEVTGIVEFDPARNSFKIYTPAAIHTFNWKNLIARSKTDADIADNIVELICAGSTSDDSRRSVGHIYKFISQWARHCENDKEKCIADHKRMIGVGTRG